VSERARSVLLVGNPDPTHVGAHFLASATEVGVSMRLCDVREAYRGAAWRRRLAWWAQGRRPAALRAFGERVVTAARETRPDVMLTTGLAPLGRRALEAVGALGIQRANYLTDDPWNPAHRAPGFLEALRQYDAVFSPRRSTLRDLEALGGPAVHYLPFAYSPREHYPAAPLDADDRARYDADLAFAGGADRDRVDVVAALLAGGLRVAVYGGYWDRFGETRASARGHVDAAGLRKAIAGARVSLCLVRRANRDGQAMRTYEVAAMGGCMLVERTVEHEALFGADGDAVVYFNSTAEAVDRARDLVAHPETRLRLSGRARALVTGGQHTYGDRLRTLLHAVDRPSHEDRLRHSRPLSRV
jgi:hypothetical protein